MFGPADERAFKVQRFVFFLDAFNAAKGLEVHISSLVFYGILCLKF